MKKRLGNYGVTSLISKIQYAVLGLHLASLRWVSLYEKFFHSSNVYELILQLLSVAVKFPIKILKFCGPNDVYAGRKDAILQRRAEKKRWTLARRKIVNLELGGVSSSNANALQLTDQQVGKTSIPPVKNGNPEDKKEQ